MNLIITNEYEASYVHFVPSFVRTKVIINTKVISFEPIFAYSA